MKRLLARGRARDDMSQTQILFALVFVNFVSISGFGMLLPVFALYGEQIGATGAQITWAIASFSLGQLLSGAMFGRLSDRYGRRPLMIAGMLGTALLYVGHVFATDPEILILVRFGAGIASGSFALSFAAGSDISTPATRARVLGIIGAGFSFGFIFGPAIGGFAAGLVPEESAFAFICVIGASLSLLAALSTALLLPETAPPQAHGSDRTRPQLRDMFRKRDYIIVLLVCLTGTTGMSMMHGVFILFADHVLLLAPLGIGLVYTFTGIFGTLTQVGAVGPLSERFGEHRVLVVSTAMVCVGMATIGSSTSIGLALVGTTAVAIGFSLLTTATTAIASMVTDGANQGTALGVLQTVTSLGRFVGPAVAGPIYDLQGPPAPFYWGAALMLLLIVGAAAWRPSVGHARSSRARHDAGEQRADAPHPD